MVRFETLVMVLGSKRTCQFASFDPKNPRLIPEFRAASQLSRISQLQYSSCPTSSTALWLRKVLANEWVSVSVAYVTSYPSRSRKRNMLFSQPHCINCPEPKP